MRFVFTKLSYLLFAVGFIPLSLSWGHPWWRWVTFAYDVTLLIVAFVDARTSRLPAGVRITREFGGRFAVGAETEVRIEIQNNTPRPVSVRVKDEYPPQMTLSGLREAHVRV